MKLRLIAVPAVLAVLAGCGGSTSGPTYLARATAPAAASASGNRAATVNEAKRLLDLAPIPSGATLTSLRPKALSGPALGTPATSSLVDKDRFFLVDEPIDQVYAYAKSHRPAPLKLAGTSSGGVGPGETSEGIGFSESDRSYATGLGVSVGLEPTDGGAKTVLRADGYGIWLDPRPIRDTTKGPRLRVTVAGGCPTSDSRAADVRNSGSGRAKRLLPKAAPTRALICEFYGANGHPRALGRSRTLGARSAARLARKAAGLSLSHLDNGATSCPMDDGMATVVALTYPGRPDFDLWVKANGCEYVDNATIETSEGLSLSHWVKPLKVF